MQTLDIRFDDPSVLCGDDHPFEGLIDQVGRGPIRGRALGFLGPELDVWIYSTSQPTQARSALRPDRVVLTAPLNLAQPARHNGREIRNGDLIEFEPGLENTESWNPGLLLDLQVDSSVARERGWSRGGESVHRLSPATLNRIRRYCERRLTADPADGSAASLTKGDRAFVRYLVDLLDCQPLPAVESQASHGRLRLVRRALQLVEASVDDEPLSVPRLAASLGVSERTLYDAFSKELGTSPYNTILVRRLNHFRRLLLEAPRRPGAVTRAATGAGFDHLSHLTRLYRRLFGEVPRETLRRHAA